jgi:NADH-quinone oxidoreductase subunit F
MAGGMKGGKLKACVPGGSSVPIINAEMTDRAILAYEEMAEVQSMVGSGGCIFLNEHTCIVTFIWRTSLFYARESCGKCTPCREGTQWLAQILDRIRKGGGRVGDIDLLLDVCSQIDGRSFCALGDAAAWPVQGAIRVFREEFEYYIANGRSMVQTPESKKMLPEPEAELLSHA